ncbi:hypothetical protein Micbo1qcDRAFT_163901 [Microdochium bolleyi]|uniref:5-hydroxyisourate hydrolase n=1 Tax=Microdochium bolleyi TaxID=196109 RepID=A0A136J2C1_9PEZI|nr:hypothetical protein Micbo1qcDRAFT_163901 [Microdochium bolleyi]
MAAQQPPTKDAITCHILDTSKGKPARGVRVQLEGGGSRSSAGHGHGHGHGAGGSSSSLKIFESQTDDDGRIKAWLPFSESTTGGDVPTYTLADVLDAEGSGGEDQTTWTLRFFTEDYFGGKDKTFFPEVVVTFTVERGQTYHVPLLLSPYSYSTYRGS